MMSANLMRFLFQELLDAPSRGAVDYIIKEQCLPTAPPGSKERELFVRISEMDDLNEQHLACAEYLGYRQLAEAIRGWIAEYRIAAD